jgi:hypothetical protein
LGRGRRRLTTRTLLRIGVGLAGIAVIYFGVLWIGEIPACGSAKEAQLAVVGGVMVAVGLVTIGAAALGQLWLAASTASVGASLFLIAFFIGLTCLS